MKWHILGAGSLGCLWAARLAEKNIPVRIILRNEGTLTRYIESPGIRLSNALRTQTQYHPIPAQLATDAEPIDCLLLACKAYDARAAVNAVAKRLHSNSLVILLQNGLGSQQAIQTLLPNVRCIAASSTEGAYLASPFHSVFAGQGHIYLGDLQEQSQPPPQQLLDNCLQAEIPCTWTTDIFTHLWRKLAVNCAINPFTVIYNCLNGELKQHPAVINNLCNELQLVLQAAGQVQAAQNLQQTVWSVIDKTSHNSSSMRQDVAQGRRTEISYITAFACAQSRALQCQTPTLFALHTQLQNALRKHGLSTT
ncbi:putative 2-dehydropantoate 2-reductase [Denitrificimonas sp. JX-1]|uniref:2-dehydropantoate 2-reductase n=1 Tax=Denitrificimonas halotolerans TaxID=3098930 RepID=A0ABU5GTG2_9GAMM|nr:putative 2-dehydropantoate 2-reductase [Denitrificimonas sp. JX-1]MDY7220084.1 putative 2-dehydropantoate 2-reductase [Denitrificimonas sp. JX-1]